MTLLPSIKVSAAISATSGAKGVGTSATLYTVAANSYAIFQVSAGITMFTTSFDVFVDSRLVWRCAAAYTASPAIYAGPSQVVTMTSNGSNCEAVISGVAFINS